MTYQIGGLAQLAERVLSMHEVWGSIPQFSKERRRCVTDMTRGNGGWQWTVTQVSEIHLFAAVPYWQVSHHIMSRACIGWPGPRRSVNGREESLALKSSPNQPESAVLEISWKGGHTPPQLTLHKLWVEPWRCCRQSSLHCEWEVSKMQYNSSE